jgi:LUD domain
VADQLTAAVPGELPAPNPEFSELASEERIEATAAALERNGVRAVVVGTGEEARRQVRSLLADGAEVFNNTSVTLESIGVAEDIERSGRYQATRLRLYQMDREMQKREMRMLAAAPDFVVGSVHAVTEEGSLLIASASGSQLGPLASGAARVILVVGGQKVVRDLDTGMRRIREYCLPMEDARARRAYGVPSGVNNLLVIHRVLLPQRVTVILVRERLGF